MEPQSNPSFYTSRRRKVNKNNDFENRREVLSSNAPDSSVDKKTLVATSPETESNSIERWEWDGGRPQYPVVVRIGDTWLVSVQDGTVVLGIEAEAWQFPSRRVAWAHLAQENFPIGLLRLAQIVSEDGTDATTSGATVVGA
jgi:hypothetical protein